MFICIRFYKEKQYAMKLNVYNKISSHLNNIWLLCKTNLGKASLCHCVRLLAGGDNKKVLMQGKVFIP